MGVRLAAPEDVVIRWMRLHQDFQRSLDRVARKASCEAMTIVGKIAESMEAKDWTLGGVVGLLTVVNLGALISGVIAYNEAQLERAELSFRVGDIEDSVESLQEWGPRGGARVNQGHLDMVRSHADTQDDKLAEVLSRVSQNQTEIGVQLSRITETLGRVDERLKFVERGN